MDKWEIEFLKNMRGLTTLYGKACTAELLDIYRLVLKPLSTEELIKAVTLWLENPNNKFFPLPAQLKALVRPIVSDEEQANLIANQIVGAISRIGPHRHNDAKEYLGEIAWAVVTLRGGWQEVCGIQNMSELGTLTAQLRDVAKAIVGRKKRGEELIPRISSQHGNLKALGVELKQLEKL